MFLVAGLGNPGPRYAATRHNVGFMVVEELARRSGVGLSTRRFEGLAARASIVGTDALLLEPLTFMNRSGDSVGPAARFYKIDPATELLVIHDEVDLEYGALRVKKGGGTAGHKGLRSIAGAIGTTDFLRVRIGVGRPQTARPVSAHVLSEFSAEETKELQALIETAADAAETVVSKGPDVAMNRYNVRNITALT